MFRTSFPALLGRAASLAAFTLALAASAAQAAQVTGTVVDEHGRPVEYCTVSIAALKRGAAADDQGRFTLELPAGRHVLEVAQLGYERSRVTLEVGEAPLAFTVKLKEEPIPLAEVAVTASAFGKTGKGEGATLRRMEVFTTPGGAADVFQSLRTLPGINAPNEGAAVYVRGGPPDETLIRLDGGEMGHPYHYEGASGGLFSSLDTYMLRSAFFSSGGFSAKYGGVLSGVLDIETQDPLNLRTVTAGANLAGGGTSTSWAIVPDKLSFIGAMRYGDPRLLFRIYGTTNDYEVTPRGTDGTGKLLWRYSGTGRASLLYLDSRDRTQLTVDHLNTRASYGERGRTQMGVLQFTDVVAEKLVLKGQVTGQYWQRNWHFAEFGGGECERNAQANLDATWSLGSRNEVSFGFNLRRRNAEIDGLYAADSTDYASGAPARRYVSRPSVSYPGFYLENKMRVWGPLYATAGARADYASSSDSWTVDPRAALAWRFDDRQIVRLATGRYHQLPRNQYLDPVYGNPKLGSMRADHVIAGYEWSSDHSNVRLEAYRKSYHDLITNQASTFYANGGHGYATGIDAYVKGNVKWLSGWVSYGYLDSKRKEFSNPRQVPSTYGVAHSVTVVGTYQYNSAWSVGSRYSASSGRPWTPVISASYDATRDLWRPAFAEDNSANLPAYHRLDLRITRLFSMPRGLGFPASGVCVAYCEGLNVLGINNVLDYSYTADYSQKHARDSYFSRRMLVAGVGLSW
jgi:vitamin B12 transporter